jgi:hypothetical protein
MSRSRFIAALLVAAGVGLTFFCGACTRSFYVNFNLGLLALVSGAFFIVPSIALVIFGCVMWVRNGRQPGQPS